MFFSKEIYSQNIKFSQFYATSLYYNPGFIAKNYCTNILLHSIITAPELSGGYKTVIFSGSKFFQKAKSGVAIYAINDIQPMNILNFQNISIAYVFSSRISNLNFSLWTQGTLYALKVNSQNIILPSNLNYSTGEQIQASALPSNYQITISPSAGFLLYSNNLFLGVSGRNLKEIFITGKLEVNEEINFLAGGNLKLKNSLIELYFFNQNFVINQIGGIWNFDKYWFGVNTIFSKNIESIGTTLGLKVSNYYVAISYSLKQYKISMYELSIMFRIKCKKSRFNTIICPAYQL